MNDPEVAPDVVEGTPLKSSAPKSSPHVPRFQQSPTQKTESPRTPQSGRKQPAPVQLELSPSRPIIVPEIAKTMRSFFISGYGEVTIGQSDLAAIVANSQGLNELNVDEELDAQRSRPKPHPVPPPYVPPPPKPLLDFPDEDEAQAVIHNLEALSDLNALCAEEGDADWVEEHEYQGTIDEVLPEEDFVAAEWDNIRRLAEVDDKERIRRQEAGERRQFVFGSASLGFHQKAFPRISDESDDLPRQKLQIAVNRRVPQTAQHSKFLHVPVPPSRRQNQRRRSLESEKGGRTPRRSSTAAVTPASRLLQGTASSARRASAVDSGKSPYHGAAVPSTAGAPTSKPSKDDSLHEDKQAPPQSSFVPASKIRLAGCTWVLPTKSSSLGTTRPNIPRGGTQHPSPSQ